jgi:hypothetical protein
MVSIMIWIAVVIYFCLSLIECYQFFRDCRRDGYITVGEALTLVLTLFTGGMHSIDSFISYRLFRIRKTLYQWEAKNEDQNL